jgi:HEAT repeat protein
MISALSAPERLAGLQHYVRSNAPGRITDGDQQGIARALRNDESDVVRHEAAFLLASLKRDGRLFDDNDAVQDLIQSFSDASILVRHEIALSLAAFPCEEAIDALLHHAADSAPEVKESIRYALVEMLQAKEKTE